MSSLSARLLISVSVLLLFFFGVTIVVLDTAFREAGEQAQEDILDGHLMQLLAAANPNDEGDLSFPPDLHEERFNTIGSGLYGELRDDSGELAWRSRSALGLEIPQRGFPRLGVRVFERESLEDGTPLLTLSLAVQWEFPDGDLKPYVFKVAESLESFNARLHRLGQAVPHRRQEGTAMITRTEYQAIDTGLQLIQQLLLGVGEPAGTGAPLGADELFLTNSSWSVTSTITANAAAAS